MTQINKTSTFLFKSYLEDGETIELILHKHVISILRELLITISIFIILPIVIWAVVPKLAIISLVVIIYGAWRAFYQTISWYFNTLLITNLNLVRVTWKGFFDRSAIRIEYNQIESFSYQVTGFINTLLNNGDVIITKNSGVEVPIHNIYKPKKKTQTLTSLQDKFMTNHQQKQSGAIKDLLTNMLEQHILEHGLIIDDE